MKISPKIIWQEAGELERSTYKGKKFEKHTKIIDLTDRLAIKPRTCSSEDVPNGKEL